MIILKLSSSLRFAIAGTVIVMAMTVVQAQEPTELLGTGLSLKFANERVPPGGMVQAKLFVTEPMPISTASAAFNFAGFELAGIALKSPAGDALGVAVVSGKRLMLSVLSPSQTLGLVPDYPVLMVTGRVPLATPLGTRIPLTMDPAAFQFLSGTGAIYPATMSPGTLTIAANVNVEDVIPGAGDLAAGDAFVVVGRGFTPNTRVRVKEIKVSDVSYIDSSHLRVTVAQATHLYGAGITVENLDGAQSRYNAYQRTHPQTLSDNPTLHDAVPLFADRDVTRAVIDVGDAATGLALQNRQATEVVVRAALLDASGQQIGTGSLRLAPSRFVLLDLSEVFGVPYAASYTVHVSASAPVQVMGVAVDAAGRATPIASR